MPAQQRGMPYRLGPRKWGIRYYGPDGRRVRQSPFESKSQALDWYRRVIEPQLRGDLPERPDPTLAQFIDLYLERHGVTVRPRTVATLRDRLRHAIAAFGDIPLRDLERMADEIAGWQAQLPPRAGHGIAQALRQVLDAGVRWEYLRRNPAKLAGRNPKPPPRAVRALTFAELDAIAAELSPMYVPMPAFAAATGLRPEEWQAVERSDVDRGTGILTVRRTVSSGKVVELAKTSASRRQVPLSPRALEALEALPPRLETRRLFPSPEGQLLNLDNFRRRQWGPAIEASGVRTPARIYDLRSTFASNMIAAGVSVFELARTMGTSIEMIDRHYGTLLDGSASAIAGKMAAFERQQEQADERLGR